MIPVTILAAAADGSGDFLVGVLLGVCLGYLVGPAFRSWQAHREWAEASREAYLTDRILASLQTDPDFLAREDPAVEADEADDTEGQVGGWAWRASH